MKKKRLSRAGAYVRRYAKKEARSEPRRGRDKGPDQTPLMGIIPSHIYINTWRDNAEAREEVRTWASLDSLARWLKTQGVGVVELRMA